MGLNKNHEVEEFNGIRCAIVEKGVSKVRVGFLKQLLEYNHYQVEVIAGTPPKEKIAVAAIAVKSEESNTETLTVNEPIAESFNIGVTDLMFNSINAVFGRLLKAPGGQIVTLAYWNEDDKTPDNEVPYYNKNKTEI